MDKIFLNKMSFYGYHGVYREENKLGQRFYVDLTIMLDLIQAGKSDHLNDTVHYGKAYELVKKIMEGAPRQLVEALAHEVAQTMLKQFQAIDQVTVKITKPDPPIPGHYNSVAVEITRGRP